ncbi:long-chain-fatty-acid--CoA ligase 6 isoform X3 [Cricetulus griseus]|uniref:Long-chain-fatty-acid--CoA ligase n=2 Tax=Cricetulus griseus TaxID=10029 RepID=A0A9J7GD80_CRIGR|nr:long-chain-fatty-acid--CoA ligase 6 isoform X3 [Cricetulus griseus]
MAVLLVAPCLPFPFKQEPFTSQLGRSRVAVVILQWDRAAEIALSLLEKMQTQEILRILRLPELGDLGQFFRSLSATTLVSMGALAAILAYWLTHRPKALQPPCNLLMQSEEVEDSGGARRSVIGGSTQLLTHYYDDARTMYQVFRRGLSISGNGPCLGFRKPEQPYRWLSYQEVANRAEFLGSGLLQHDCKVGTEQFIGVFAQNRPEWIIAELACYTYSMVVVPLYDTLGPGAIRYIINTADIRTVIVDKPQKAILLLEHVERKETLGLKLIILMEPFEDALRERGQKCGVDIKSMKAIEDCGQENHHAPVPPRPDDLSIVCFTSGTTGNPKGAMLTHGNVVADFSGFLKVTESQWAPTCADVHFSYLPLAHMFERMVQSVVYCHGGRVGFFQGDIRLLSDDMKALRPTIFPVVPRLLNRMYDKIFYQADTSLKRWLLEFAAKRKQAEVRSGIIRNNSIWDELFFNKIQASLGGHVRMIVTGAAPASPTVLGFLRAALGCQVYEGYGQTECTAGCTFTTPGDWTSGHVGAPLPCNHIKLVDAEELNYWTSKGEGEICVKGPNVFKGYLKDEDRTKEALDSDGWLHTGDIGKWLPEGTLKIIDRKKHIFKLAQGEYVAPEKIENIYIRSEPVAQIYVHGDSLKAFLVGIVVPDPEVMPAWAQKKGIEGTYQELCANKELKKAILDDMVRLGKESGLYSFEQTKYGSHGYPPAEKSENRTTMVKAIHIHSDMFSVQNGLLTPTLKAKRPELREYFKKQIEELYSISM